MIQLSEFSNLKNFDVLFLHSQKDNEVSLKFKIRGPATRLYPKALPSLKLRNEHTLWKKTCLEAFFFDQKDARYTELNFNILGEYDILHFESYRIASKLPAISLELTAIQRQVLENEITGEVLLKIPSHLKLILAPAAILMDPHGKFSHYALAHGEKPDFHNKQVIENKGFSILT